MSEFDDGMFLSSCIIAAVVACARVVAKARSARVRNVPAPDWAPNREVAPNREPEYFLFMAGDPIPTWAERFESNNPTARLLFAIDVEVWRFSVGNVLIRPLFPVTNPCLFRVEYVGYRPFCTIDGAPTHIDGMPRNFENGESLLSPHVIDFVQVQ